MKIRIRKSNLFLLSSRRIKTGDLVLADKSYPHWTEYPMKCTRVGFEDGTIGLVSSVRVKESSFRVVLGVLNLKTLKYTEYKNLETPSQKSTDPTIERELMFKLRRDSGTGLLDAKSILQDCNWDYDAALKIAKIHNKNIRYKSI